MANGLYDSGKPQRIIVEHEVRVKQDIARRLEASWCFFARATQCVGSPHTVDITCMMTRQRGWCKECPFRAENARVTIAPQFEEVKERKLLK